jgi:transcriptional regulator with XRE-family HTH domain
MDAAATGEAAFGQPPLTAQQLIIRCGDQSRSIDPAQREVTIGRDPSSTIKFDYSWMSRTHVRLRREGEKWVAVDNSRNGMYIDGVRHESVVVADGMTVRLGDAEGFAVEFFLGHAGAASGPGDEYGDDGVTAEEDVDPDIARAGAAVAARRRELELTQRGLARDKIINAGALIAFEKGRSWPHESTRTKLEEILQWPTGSITGIRQGAPSPDDETTQVISTAVASPLIAQTIQLALRSVDTAMGTLPDSATAEFRTAATAILSDLRNLQAVAGDAARNAPGAPALVIALGAVRRRYDELMTRVATAPGATAGQRLFAARRRANLTAEDAALAAGLPVQLIQAAEAGQSVPPHAEAAITSLLNDLEEV